MIRKYVFILLLIVALNNSWSQGKSSTLIESSSNRPIADADIYNKTTKKTARSDEQGNFTIKAKKNDSIYIYKLGYNFISTIASKIEQPILMDEISYQMEEVFLSDGDPELVQKQYEKNFSFAAHSFGFQAFKIKLPEQHIITSIELPIKTKARAYNKGKMIFQLFTAKEDLPNLKSPITNKMIIDEIEELKRKLQLDFNNFNTRDKAVAYLVIQRMLPIDDEKRLKHEVLNPIIKTNGKSKSKKNYLLRNYGSSKWLDSSLVYGDAINLSLCYKLYGYEL